MSKDHNIIAVPEIPLYPEIVLHEAIELMEVDVREYLARDVSDRNTFRPFNSSLSLFPEETTCRRNLVALDDLREEAQHPAVLYTTLEEAKQHRVIHAVEEPPNVRSPEPTTPMPPKELLSSLYGSVQPLPPAARPGIEDEAPVVEAHEFVVEQAMDEAVTDGGDGDAASFIVADRERAVRPVVVGSLGEVYLKRLEVCFEVIAEALELRSATLSPREGEPTPIESP